ncbi:hypothetical protein [Thiolapillus sp.]
MTPYLALILALVVLAGILLILEIRRKNMHIWLPAYISRKKRPKHEGPTHIMFCFVDHFEPRWSNADYETEVRRVNRWIEQYPKIAGKHKDADGCYPKHCFYYPEEEYRKEHLEKIEHLCKKGFGEIEIHLHHHNDTEAGLRKKLSRFTQNLHQTHGALSIWPESGKLAWGFVHGNWALDNSEADGSNCGINNELIILEEEGCYADFTLPSAPSATQTAKINSIYYAKDDPQQPKSHNEGQDVTVGRAPWGDLMIVQGPLMLNWRNRKWGLLPRIENADIRANHPPTADRIALWVEAGIHVQGRPEWVFIKIHTHGTQESDMDALLGDPVDAMFSELENHYNDGENYVLHYVSTRETYNIIKAAENGKTGNPHAYRDYILPPPAYNRN